jgi:hypothetical protein
MGEGKGGEGGKQTLQQTKGWISMNQPADIAANTALEHGWSCQEYGLINMMAAGTQRPDVM